MFIPLFVQLRSRVRGRSVCGCISGSSGGGGSVWSRSDGKPRLCMSVTLFHAFCLQVSNRYIFFTGHSLQRRIQPVFAILIPLIHFQIFGLSDTSPTAADLGGKTRITLLDKKKKKKAKLSHLLQTSDKECNSKSVHQRRWIFFFLKET